MEKKYLILPDIHLRHEKAEKIIAFEKPDKIIFLGDYLDDFNDTPEMITKTADWLHWSINQKNRIHLAGNHDLHYWFKDNDSMRCSGYEQFKSIAINDFVTKEDWEKLRFFYILDGKWLLSHAGLHPSWIDSNKFQAGSIVESSLEKLKPFLEASSINAKKEFYKGGMHWFAMPGFSRSRSPYYGGITWCDWTKEFHPIRGIHQIVGHTPDYTLRWSVVEEGGTKIQSLPLEGVCNPTLSDKSSYNICLDSHPGSQYYAIYEDGKFTVHKAEDIK